VSSIPASLSPKYSEILQGFGGALIGYGEIVIWETTMRLRITDFDLKE
jgi:hypothetical protein